MRNTASTLDTYSTPADVILILGARLKFKRSNPRHHSAALFSHFEGVNRYPGADAGNISIYTHRHGWIWLIPQPDGGASVGAVCSPESLKTRQGIDTEMSLIRTLALHPDVADHMADTHRVAPVHATGNDADTCTPMTGPHRLLLGEAYAFVDPMFFSGVFIAMQGAERGAVMVDTVLHTPTHESRLQRALHRHLNRGLNELKWFIYGFTSATMRLLFNKPGNTLQVEQAVVAMLSGDVFNTPAVQ